MFLRTDLTYNDSGDIFYYERNGTFRKTFYPFSKTSLNPKEKYIQLYQADLRAKKLPLETRPTRKRKFFQGIDSAYNIVKNYNERKASKKPLLPYQLRIQEILDSEDEGTPLTDPEAMHLVTFRNRRNIDEDTFMQIVKLVKHGYEFLPFTDWNSAFDDPTLEKRKEEVEQERREREFQEKWKGISFLLPESEYDHERMEWRSTLAQRERALEEERRRQEEIEMDVAGDAEMARMMQEEFDLEDVE